MDPLTLALLLAGGRVAGGAAWRLRSRRRRAAGSSPWNPAGQGRGGRPGQQPRESPPDPERTLDQLRPKDVILLEDRDYLVAGLLRLQEGGRRWTECLLRDVDHEQWLVIPEEPEPFVRVGRLTRDLPLTSPPSQLLEHGGAVHRLVRRGLARSHREGDPGPGTGGDQAAFWDYQAPGPGRIWLRRFDGSMLAFAGEQVPRHRVTLLPGSPEEDLA